MKLLPPLLQWYQPQTTNPEKVKNAEQRLQQIPQRKQRIGLNGVSECFSEHSNVARLIHNRLGLL